MNKGFETILKKIRHQIDTAEHRETHVYIRLNHTSSNDFDTARHFIKQIKLSAESPERLTGEIDFLSHQINEIENHTFQFGLHALRREREGLQTLQKMLISGDELEVRRFKTALELIDATIVTECKKESPNKYTVLSQVEDIIQAFASPETVKNELKKTRKKIHALREKYKSNGKKRTKRKLTDLETLRKYKTQTLKRFPRTRKFGQKR